MADLTYDTTVISVEYLPIGIGYVTTYAAKCLPGQFSFQIYKFTDSLLDAIGASLPDILALGFFAWNKNLSLLAPADRRKFSLWMSLLPSGSVNTIP